MTFFFLEVIFLILVEKWYQQKPHKKTRGKRANLRGAQFGKHWSRGTKPFYKILRGTSAKKVKKHWLKLMQPAN